MVDKLLIRGEFRCHTGRPLSSIAQCNKQRSSSKVLFVIVMMMLHQVGETFSKRYDRRKLAIKVVGSPLSKEEFIWFLSIRI